MVKRIPLNGKYGKGKFALVDDDMFEYLNQWKWYYYGRYVVRSAYNKQTKKLDGFSMHRLIMSALPGNVVDHIDHDPLNNTKVNLRLVTGKQNSYNRRSVKNTTSQYKGVHYNKRLQRWRAQIGVEGKYLDLGNFDSESEAAKAYNDAARLHFGEHAYLNHVFGFDSRTVDIKPKRQPRSQFNGVNFDIASNKWRSRSYLDGKRIHLGVYASEEEAAHAHDIFVKTHNLDRRLNFPD